MSLENIVKSVSKQIEKIAEKEERKKTEGGEKMKRKEKVKLNVETNKLQGLLFEADEIPNEVIEKIVYTIVQNITFRQLGMIAKYDKKLYGMLEDLGDGHILSKNI